MSAEKKGFPEPVKRIAREWKYSMPVISPAIMILNPERLAYRIDLINILLAGGIGFAAGVLMDWISKDDSERMRRWFNKGAKKL